MATKTQEKQTAVVGGESQIKHFDNLRNILKNAKHSSGQDLYTHLVEVMNHIVMHCPEQGLDKFEEISNLLKQQKEGKIANLSEFLKVSEERPYSKPGKDDTTAKYIAKARKFFDVSTYIMQVFFCIRNMEQCQAKEEKPLKEKV
jgi:hypothetical protein